MNMRTDEQQKSDRAKIKWAEEKWPDCLAMAKRIAKDDSEAEIAKAIDRLVN